MKAKPKTIAVLVLIALVMSSATIRAAESDRVREGLVVYYPFTEGSGSTLSDQSNNGSALNLELSGAVAWLADSTGVDFTGGRIGTSTSADKIINALTASGASTFEIWAHPANLTQHRLARLISVGIDRGHQNFVLGQDESDYQVQLRHTDKSSSGSPYLTFRDGVATALQHIVHTYNGTVERLYIDGVECPETVERSGNYSKWDTTHLLSIGNEADSERPFYGKVYLVAVYDRALSSAEVQQNFAAGHDGTPAVNTAPQIDAIYNVTINQNDTMTVSLSASDPDGNSLSFSSPDLPGFATLNNLAGNRAEIVLTPAHTDIGSYDVTVVVTDDATTPLSDQTTFTITVKESKARVSEGLVVYYPFTEGSGSTLSDQSNNGSALNLKLSGAVAWLADSIGVNFTGGRIGTSTSADKIINALIASGASTFEIWAHPANLTQHRSRLISVGIDHGHQNFMLVQEGSYYQVQLRHTDKSPSGRPYLKFRDGVATALQHIVHTYNGTVERLHIDGVECPETVERSGNYSKWDTTHLFSIGNEADSDQPFYGKVYLVAVYDRALSSAEVQQNFAATAPEIDAIDNVTIKEIDTMTIALSASNPGWNALSFSSPDLPGFATLNNLAGNKAEIVLAPAHADIGSYDVTVVVTNDAAPLLSDQTKFTITVKALNARVCEGLVVYYPFTEGAGSTLGDQSGNRSALNLELSGEVTWLTDSIGVDFTGGRIGTGTSADKIINALTASGASTFEIWAQPANLTQDGPARLISVGGDTSNQNFVLGQAGSSYQVRLLHTAKSSSGTPHLETSDGVSTALQHIVHTYDGTVERFYLDGVERPEAVAQSGNYSNWDTTDLFSIGNEAGSDRSFYGKVYLVAVYGRALSSAEVQKNFNAGKEDNDSMPDIWEMENFGNLDHDCDTDANGDGVYDCIEYKLGRDPNATDSKGPGIHYEYDELGRIKRIERIPSK